MEIYFVIYEDYIINNKFAIFILVITLLTINDKETP